MSGPRYGHFRLKVPEIDTSKPQWLPRHPNRRWVVITRWPWQEYMERFAIVKSPEAASFAAILPKMLGRRVHIYVILVPDDYDQ